MLKKLFIAAAFCLTSAAAHADFLGLYAGVGYWREGFTGNVIQGVSVANELGAGTNNGNYLYVAFEHPIPLIPNIKVARTSIDVSGSGTLSSSFVYQGQTFNTNQQVNSTIDLTNTDVTLYYQLLDTGVNLDVGLTGRMVQGKVSVDTATQDVKVTIPMVYAHAKVPLPMTHTYLDGNANFVTYHGNTISDIAVGIGWSASLTLMPEIGVELGYRRFSINVDQAQANVNVDTAIDGVFLNVTGHF